MALALLSGCGGDTRASSEPLRPKAANAGVLDGVRYEAVRLRVLDGGRALDRRFVDGRRPGPGERIYAAFLHACNVADRTTSTTSSVHLLHGGERYAPVPTSASNPFAYRRVTLYAGQCLPRNDSPAEPLSARVASFRVPRAAARGSAFRLELRAGGKRLTLRLPPS